MLKIKNTISFAVVLCGLLVAFGSMRVSAQWTTDKYKGSGPSGSYFNSCTNISLTSSTLGAACEGKKNIFGGDSSGTGNLTSLNDVFECEGDIWNDNKTLRCKRNQNSKHMQIAKAAIDVAFLDVTGTKIDNDLVYLIYLRDLFEIKGIPAAFFLNSLDKGIYPAKIRQHFIDWMSNPLNAVKPSMIDFAFKQVYGVGVGSKDKAYYMSQKVGFSDIIAAERTKMLADKVIHRLAIFYAYKKVMDRAPTAAEYATWTARSETHKEIIDAERGYLYSPAGAKDLTETVKRALADQGVYNPSSEQINQAIAKYSQKKRFTTK